MEKGPTQETVREAVGVFYDPRKLQDAIDELQSSGFNHHDLSLLASRDTIEEKLGDAYAPHNEDLEDDPRAPRREYRPPEDRGNAKGILIGAPLYLAATVAAGLIVASGGTLAALLGGTVIAGGSAGLIGMAFANKVEHDHAEALMGQLDRGGLLLWVRTPTHEQERAAFEVLLRNGGQDVHVHTLIAPDPDRHATTLPRAFDGVEVRSTPLDVEQRS